MSPGREAEPGPAARRLPALTELEGCVLGIVWSRGPCTAYVARKVFLDSPSPYWSGSAGAVYPLLARLEGRGFVRAQAHSAGRRASRRFALTPRGRRMLGRWLGPPLPAWILGIPMDPLRTRMGFLGALPAAQQASFLAEAERKARVHLEAARREMASGRAGRDLYDRLVSRGAVTSLEARLTWLRGARRCLGRSR
jgi:DNA-binding PadR family transcriptional regulator